MALDNGGERAKRYSIKLGKIMSWDRDDTGSPKEAGTRFTGKFGGVYLYEQEFEGKPNNKFNIVMHDGDVKSILDISQESYGGYSLIAKLSNPELNLDEELVFRVYPSDQNEKITFVWVGQGKKVIVENPEVPKPKTVVVGKNKLKDYTDFIEWSAKWLVEMELKYGIKHTETSKESEVPEEDDIPF